MVDETGGSFTTTGERLRNWKATLDLQPIVQAKPLKVRGEYRLNGRCGSASLREKVPADFNPRILAIEVVEQPGTAKDEWLTLEDQFEAEEGQYDQVRIAAPDGEEVTVDVEEVH